MRNATGTAEGVSPTDNSSPVSAASIVNTTLAIVGTGTLKIINGGVNAPKSGMNVFF